MPYQKQNRRRLGTAYEARAADYLRQRGYRIVARNFRTREGEIDLIARGDGYLCFVEVKYRTDGGCGAPEEAVDARKQRRICRAAQYYMLRNGYQTDTPCRFDVIAIAGTDIRHIPNAFLFLT